MENTSGKLLEVIGQRKAGAGENIYIVGLTK